MKQLVINQLVINQLVINQLVINQTMLYTVGDNKYFVFKYKNSTQRDINVKLGKNNKYILVMIAEVCELDYKGLNKKKLFDLITNSNCLVFN
jgi:predicted nucleic acid-binding Zn finger protein